ncbi:MAG: hypothetical protein JW967_04555 [Dehalococcoidales bacterium]|nr:hypothetical protein [Dehalococcoidales bacterium]
MVANKYDEYFLTEPKMPIFLPEHQAKPNIVFQGAKIWKGLPFFTDWETIREPWFMDPKPMKHDFDQIVAFIGGNFDDPWDFGAEIEFCMGEEEEKHIITKTTIVYIPKGMVHAPLNFKRVDKPILFQNICLSDHYMRLVKDDNGNWVEWEMPEEMKKLKES